MRQFILGKTYQTLDGNFVKIVGEFDKHGERFVEVLGDDDKWRYDRPQDCGRVTGLPHTMTYPKNLIPGSEQ